MDRGRRRRLGWGVGRGAGDSKQQPDGELPLGLEVFRKCSLPLLNEDKRQALTGLLPTRTSVLLPLLRARLLILWRKVEPLPLLQFNFRSTALLQPRWPSIVNPASQGYRAVVDH